MSDGEDYGSPEAVQPGGGNNARQHTPSHRKGPRFSWTPAYEATFFRSLCESVKLGLKDNHSFKQEAWDRAVQALAERHAAYPNKGHLINKSDNARKKFRLWRGLREDPEFLYNPNARTVTASEEAWRAHIEREPLSKSLRNRPFEHEDYMEILFPDVVGSGGAPKRITKPRRKGADSMIEGDDLDDTPGTNVLNLLGADTSLFQSTPIQTPIQPPTVPSNGTVRPTSTTLPARTSIASSSALTPPDEVPTEPAQNGNTRKRYLGSNNGAGPSSTGEKRRRTANNNYIDLTHSAQLSNSENPGSSNNPGATNRTQHFQDAMIVIAEQIRAQRLVPAQPAAPNWPQQAMEVFFRDFGDEEMDLQIKIGEKVLCDNNKAMMFCMMPEDLRRHWVKRLRELHNLNGGSSRGDINIPGPGVPNGSGGMIAVPGMQMGGPMGNQNPMMRNGSQLG
ncbi:Myb/SANT-like DNA-binding domain-containing protein [Diaporthe sp. PMI_573]|nr:Myb/SANT-like DNA-binding domain-containing protein [Diaporthaceae sp. PMI_573]